jgi:hypothetical protein
MLVSFALLATSDWWERVSKCGESRGVCEIYPSALIEAMGVVVVRQKAAEGDREAQWSLGMRLLSEAPGGCGCGDATWRGQGLTLVRFSAQLEPCLTRKNTLHTLHIPYTPSNTPLTRDTQPLRAPPIPYKALKLS